MRTGNGMMDAVGGKKGGRFGGSVPALKIELHLGVSPFGLLVGVRAKNVCMGIPRPSPSRTKCYPGGMAHILGPGAFVSLLFLIPELSPLASFRCLSVRPIPVTPALSVFLPLPLPVTITSIWTQPASFGLQTKIGRLMIPDEMDGHLFRQSAFRLLPLFLVWCVNESVAGARDQQTDKLTDPEGGGSGSCAERRSSEGREDCRIS